MNAGASRSARAAKWLAGTALSCTSSLAWADAPSEDGAPPVPAENTAELGPVESGGGNDDFYGNGAGSLGTFEALEQAPKLDLYGFIDFTYTQNLNQGDTPFDTLPHFGSFSVGNINLYASGELGNGFRSLLEVRLLYLPNGTNDRDLSGSAAERFDTTTYDYADFERNLRWGGIEIERAFLEYQANEWLAFQLGQFLTPYGIWNIDHGTPTVIGIRRPFIIGEALFPERQTGLEAHGAFHIDKTSVGYHVTLSNGRGPLDSHLDLDANKAVGGRLFVRNSSIGTLTLGSAAYYGTSTDRETYYGFEEGVDPPLLEVRDPILYQFRELALAADLRWEWQGLLLQGEAIHSQRVYEDEYRRKFDGGRALQSDYARFGAYGILGYRTPYWGIMPFASIEGYDFAGNETFGHVLAEALGLNIRPQSNVVFKLQYVFAILGDENTGKAFRGTLRRLETQAAWAF